MLTNDKIPEWLWPFWKLTSYFFPGWKDSWLLLLRKPNDWLESKEPKKILDFNYIPQLKKK